ncbi:hypothetical protein [Burkholderia sp. ABCPW 11]|uniref:hypothetical protein n=1 Tax=Burkholderia sp. ABCPW 11 TaxID=1637859 RepID=UPI000A7F8F59|nr:hypothetical protein [Burkholderia sp. ABCPW 11]
MFAGPALVLLLEGALDVSYGDRRVVLTTDGRRTGRMACEVARPAVRMQSFLLNAVAPDTFRRRLSKGRLHGR